LENSGSAAAKLNKESVAGVARPKSATPYLILGL